MLNGFFSGAVALVNGVAPGAALVPLALALATLLLLAAVTLLLLQFALDTVAWWRDPDDGMVGLTIEPSRPLPSSSAAPVSAAVMAVVPALAVTALPSGLGTVLGVAATVSDLHGVRLAA